MADVIRLSDYRADPWKEVFTVDGPNSTLQVYLNTVTGAVEIVQMNDDDEAIRTQLDKTDVQILMAILTNRSTVNNGPVR